MKHCVIYFGLVSFLLAGCSPIKIITYNPVPAQTHYSTTISSYKTKTTTTITQVNAGNEDISLQLDLQAVAALFAQANSVEEFENMLNNGQYPVSNLDLNGDGYIDYLRVLETVDGYNHVFLIQAVLADDVFQDVATLVAESPGAYSYYLEIIGAPYIYGPNYIIRPEFYAKPPIFEFVRAHASSPWLSPWYWDHFPAHYHHPKPIILNHYQAYVRTYMEGHPYCHEVCYPEAPHYKDWEIPASNYQRKDYENKHPEKSFAARNADTPSQTGQDKVKNAYDIRRNNDATKTISTSDSRQETSNATRRVSGTSSGSATASTSSKNTSGRSTASTSSKNTSGAATRSTGSTASRNNSGTSRKGTGNSSNSQNTSRSSGSTARSYGSTSGTSGSSSSESSSKPTVTRSRVSSSGTSTTKTSSATTNRSSSTRSSATKSSSRSSSTSSRSSRR